MPPRFRRKLPSLIISAEGREIRDQRARYSTAARVICTAVAAVMEIRMYSQRCYVRYVLRTVSTAALLQQLRELRIRMQYYYSRTYDMYSSSSSSSSCNGATHVCTVIVATYGMYYLQYLQQQLLWPYLLRSYAVGHRNTVYSQSFYKQTKQYQSCR